MKIGILTFHNAVNYGAVLQAYALKKFLEENDNEVEIINYKSEFIENVYNKPFSKNYSLKSKIKNIMTWNIQLKRNKKFEEFARNFLEINNTDVVNKIMESIEKKYDKIIVGSDQVWSTLCTNNDTTYYLDFVSDSSKKISYAASFGIVDENYYENKEIKKLLSEFSKVSVRENIGLEIYKKMTNKSAITCVDPTFLLSKNEWTKELPKINVPNYLLVYSLGMDDYIVEYAKKIAATKSLNIIYFTLNNLFTIKNRKKVIIGSPMEFLSYIEKADFIVTNSFHGTAFSIIFNKEFIVVKNNNKKHDNSRLENIINLLNLNDRLVDRDNMKIVDKKIEYNEVNLRMNELVGSSKKFLKEI